MDFIDDFLRMTFAALVGDMKCGDDFGTEGQTLVAKTDRRFDPPVRRLRRLVAGWLKNPSC